MQKTVDRLAPLEDIAEVITVTNRDHFFVTRDEYTAGSASFRHFFVLEPCARNTAPAVAVGALAAVARHGPEAMLLVLPADHLVDDEQAFAATVRDALQLRQHVTRWSPSAYRQPIRRLASATSSAAHRSPAPEGFQIARFTEKPSADAAARMVESGRFYWNSGMFCFRAATLLEELALHAPEILEGATRCWEAVQIKDDRADLPEDLFAATARHLDRLRRDGEVCTRARWCRPGSAGAT